jgi:hypothetical protein
LPLPDFFVIGAMKAGTSSLHHYLRQHPQIFMSPVKEPQYYAFAGRAPDFRGPGDEQTVRELVTDREAYAALFAGAGPEQRVGEASTFYLYSERAAERLAAERPEARLVAILRDPAERAFSNYMHWVRDGREPCASFAQALADEPRRIEEHWAWHWHYRRLGRYAEQLERYLARFDRSRIHVLLLEELDSDAPRVMRELFAFLGVDPDFRPDLELRFNVSGIPRSRSLDAFARRRHPWLRRLVPERLRLRLSASVLDHNLRTSAPPTAVLDELRADYRDEIARLERLLDRDLSAWRGTDRAPPPELAGPKPGDW